MSTVCANRCRVSFDQAHLHRPASVDKEHVSVEVDDRVVLQTLPMESNFQVTALPTARSAVLAATLTVSRRIEFFEVHGVSQLYVQPRTGPSS